jgi:hypothetical protein
MGNQPINLTLEIKTMTIKLIDNNEWAVLDEDGYIIETFTSREEALDYIQSMEDMDLGDE